MSYPSRNTIDPVDLAEVLLDLHLMASHCFDDEEDYEDIVRYIASNLGLSQEFLDIALEFKGAKELEDD